MMSALRFPSRNISFIVICLLSVLSTITGSHEMMKFESASSIEADRRLLSSSIASSRSSQKKASSEGSSEPWTSCLNFTTKWVNKVNVGCVNRVDGYFRKAIKWAVFGDPNTGTTTYDGTFQGCKEIFRLGLDHDWDQYIHVDPGYYITYRKSSKACFFYKEPGNDNGCDEWQARSSDRTAMYCGSKEDSSDGAV